MGVPERIKEIEDEIRRTQINKATNHHVGLLRAKIARLKQEQEEKAGRSSKSTGGYSVRRSGDSTVSIIGLPSVGKSTLLNNLTGADSKIGAFDFTTLDVVPGMMTYKGAKIQILDLPGIIKGAASGKGFGKKVLSVARTSNLVIMVVDVFKPDQTDLLRNELAQIGIRLDQKPPNITVDKKGSGGIQITNLVPESISNSLIGGIMRINKIHHARVFIPEPITTEQFIDVILGNRVYINSVTILNKVDLVDKKTLDDIKSKIRTNFIPISADKDKNLENLKDAIYQQLDLIRIYLRPKGGEADYEEPLIVPRDSSIFEICAKIHRDVQKNFRYAYVWGNSAKFKGQKVGKKHIVEDEDVVTLINKK
jgi:small GTP-binding protein|tara:strand:+ start:933 stop:2030 length:1098 start_codon:yes stop_codon:yes gene_type:complete